jgi:hypothetical protein
MNFADNTPNSAPAASDPTVPSASEFDPGTCNQETVLALLRQRDLAPEIIRQIHHSAALMMSRKVRFAVAAHPRAPRRIALPSIRELHTGDLARFAVLPAAAADLKRFASQILLARLPSMTLGERISLARRAPAIVAAALLLDKESQVRRAARNNPRLPQTTVVNA